MPRYRISIEYDGTPFVGWQTQAVGVSVQSSLETAIAGFTGEHLTIRGAGRTDSGVHALGQVAHFDLQRAWDPHRIREAMNYHLRPAPIVVLDCVEADPRFDARFSAVKRHYLYRILARRAPPALDLHRVWWLPIPLSVEAMSEAARHLVGRHDFTTFRAASCQANSPLRTLDDLTVTCVGEEIHIATRARSFLHNQVRSMVGSLKLVGTGRWQPDDVGRALRACDRAACGPVAPAAGLYLVKVDYPADIRRPAPVAADDPTATHEADD